MVTLTQKQARNPLTSPKDGTFALPLGYNANISSIETPRENLLSQPTHIETESGGYKRNYNYRQWRSQVTEAMYLYGNMDKQAQEFGSCSERPVQWRESNKPLKGDETTVWLCSGDLNHKAAMFCRTCDNRCCPDCAARQSARFIARFLPKALEVGLSGGEHALRHIVLTTPIALTSDTPDKIRTLYKNYSKLPRKALEMVQNWGLERGRAWNTLGAIQSAEFGSDGEKLHFHVIQYGNYIPQKELSEAWSSVTDGQSSIVFVGGIKRDENSLKHAIIEALKYSTKFWKTNTLTGEIEYLPPNVIPHLMQVLKKTRRVKAWGIFYKLPKPEKEPLCCPDCNAEMIRIGTDIYESHLGMHKSVEQLLNLKLANKSKFSKPDGNKPPPDIGSKSPIPKQKPLFETVNKDNWSNYE